MSIDFSYKIISVDASARCMEVVYTAEGHPIQHMGTRLPYEGETVESVVLAYAPIQLWLELKKAVVVPEVGISGNMPLATEMEQERQRFKEMEGQVKTTGAQTL
jgi:hypothetical protein